MKNKNSKTKPNSHQGQYMRDVSIDWGRVKLKVIKSPLSSSLTHSLRLKKMFGSLTDEELDEKFIADEKFRKKITPYLD